jgi:hypothetical protein
MTTCVSEKILSVQEPPKTVEGLSVHYFVTESGSPHIQVYPAY